MDIRFFIDTSVFVQSFDASDPERQDKAQALIGAALVDHIGVVSYQVVDEVLLWLRSYFDPPLQKLDAQDYLEEVLLPLNEIFFEADICKQALALGEEHGFSYKDASVVAAAVKGGCRILYGTRFPHGTVVGSLLLQNPFVKKGETGQET